MITALLKAGADPKNSTLYPFVTAVIRNAPRDLLLNLLNAGADINEVHPDHGTSLHYVVNTQQINTLVFLLSHNADRSVLNKDALTPLEYAFHYRPEGLDVIELLQKPSE